MKMKRDSENAMAWSTFVYKKNLRIESQTEDFCRRIAILKILFINSIMVFRRLIFAFRIILLMSSKL